ncbi:MAG: hypothetical protein JWQ71_3801 [Pedosphaera sp.]|nr:hypothetical protein [Pedosphaera sp.]
MNLVFAAALELQSFFQQQNWKFCIIGGLALQRWGEPRLTLDVDVTLLTGFGEEEKFIDPLLARFRGRRPDARDFALTYRVLLLEGQNEVGLDVAMGALPFEEGTIHRASSFQVGPGQSLLTCSAEDLIVHKCFAGRDRDWADVETVLVKQHRHLDFKLIWTELSPLLELKQEPDTARRLQALITKVEDNL